MLEYLTRQDKHGLTPMLINPGTSLICKSRVHIVGKPFGMSLECPFGIGLESDKLLTMLSVLWI